MIGSLNFIPGAWREAFFALEFIANRLGVPVELLQHAGETVAFRGDADDEVLHDGEAVENPADDKIARSCGAAKDDGHDDEYGGGTLEMQYADAAKEFRPPPPEFLPAAKGGEFYFGRAAMDDGEDFLVRHTFDDTDGEQQAEQHGEPRVFALVPGQPAEEEILQICSRSEQEHRAAKPHFHIPLHLAGKRLFAKAMPHDEPENRDRDEPGQYSKNRPQNRLEDQTIKNAGNE